MSVTLIDTKLVLTFSDQKYYNSNINNSASNQNIYNFVDILSVFQTSEATEIMKEQKYEFDIE